MVFRRLVKLYGEGGIYVRGGLDSGEPPAGGGGQKTHARNINRNLHAVNFILLLLLLLLSILMNLYLNISFLRADRFVARRLTNASSSQPIWGVV